MSTNDAILVGANEIAGFMRISVATLLRLRDKYNDLPIYQESPKALLMADKEALVAWQRRLCARKG